MLHFVAEHRLPIGCEVASVPDDICEVSAGDLAQWLRDRTAVAVDCREPIEAQYERRTGSIL